MAKYSKGAQKSVASAMERMEKGTLRSGKSGKKVADPKQAIAIGLSEAREKGAKVPSKKTAATAPKKTTKKAVSKKTAAKKTVVPAAKRQVTKAPVKKTLLAKPLAKKAGVKKGTPGKIVKEKEVPAKAIMPVAEETVARAANLNGMLNDPGVEEKSPAIENDGNQMMKEEKKLIAKINSKMDARHNMQLSQSKAPIRPSGKKPLWNR